MKLYADTPGRRGRQLVSDLWMAFWIALWVWVGMKTDDLVMNLALPGEGLRTAGERFESGLDAAGDQAGRIPVLGDDLRAPFDSAGGAGTVIRDAGQAQIDAVDTLATFLGVVIALIPITIWLLLWAPIRLRFVRRATAARRFIDDAPDLDLFALRALANQPMAVLGRLHDDPSGAWRNRDPEVIRALAEIELRESGLKVPG